MPPTSPSGSFSSPPSNLTAAVLGGSALPLAGYCSLDRPRQSVFPTCTPHKVAGQHSPRTRSSSCSRCSATSGCNSLRCRHLSDTQSRLSIFRSCRNPCFKRILIVVSPGSSGGPSFSRFVESSSPLFSLLRNQGRRKPQNQCAFWHGACHMDRHA
jgi:hypothetical protein